MTLPSPFPHATTKNADGFRVVIDGEVWSCVTNGFSLAGRRIDSEWPEEAGRAKVVQGSLVAEHAPVDLDVLRAFLGKAEVPCEIECPDCGGSGRHHEADGACDCERCRCEECDGSAKIVKRPAQRAVKIGASYFDANLVASSLLRVCPDSDAWIGTSSDGAIFVRGNSWVAITLPVLPTEEQMAKAPTFEGVP